MLRRIISILLMITSALTIGITVFTGIITNNWIPCILAVIITVLIISGLIALNSWKQ